MANEFEEARHQGYSAADMTADIEEQENRINELGCLTCAYGERYSNTCITVREETTLYTKCPYRKEK